MTLSIYNNLMANNTARTLGESYSRLATSIQRLSSGLRINSAADDAAGLAIRELMRTDIAATHQGIRNANDAISMIQTADGALSVIDEKLIRMKELAEQAATGTYNSTQRLIIDSEFQAMGAEIDRIARATDFNGIKLLDGSLSGTHDGSGLTSTGAMKIHFGPGNDSAEDYYYVEIGDCTLAGLGLRGNSNAEEMIQIDAAVPGWWNNAVIDYKRKKILLDIKGKYAGKDGSTSIRGMDFYQLPLGLQDIKIVSNAAGIPWHKPHVCIFSTDGTQLTGPPIDGEWRPEVNESGWCLPANGGEWWSISTDPDSPTVDGIMNSGINEGIFDATATYDGSKTSYYVGNIKYNNIEIEIVTSQNEIGDRTFAGVAPGGVLKDEVLVIDDIVSELVFFIGGHDNSNTKCNYYTLTIEAEYDEQFLDYIFQGNIPDFSTLAVTSVTGDKVISIKTQQLAQEALPRLDDAIVKKDNVRAHLGALQNRFENTATNLAIQAENLQAAESRISDTDVAVEMTEFVRNQILTQSATAMLAQANSLPQMLAGLLEG